MYLTQDTISHKKENDLIECSSLFFIRLVATHLLICSKHYLRKNHINDKDIIILEAIHILESSRN